MKRTFTLLASIYFYLVVLSPASAQHDMHIMHEMAEEKTETKVAIADGSGTSWMPGATPEYMSMYHYDNSHLMLHGNIFARYTYADGPRGDKEFSSPNWIMGMYTYELGESDELRARAMISLDRLTEGYYGYPLLLQTGEGLIDRQHPHDLFAELSIAYKHSFNDDISVNIYAGLPGEPSIGPPVFMHRASAFSNPDAPLGHHLQDATHITNGVITLGFAFDNLKLEGSIFNGSEPDGERYGIESPKLNSYSGRISYNPNDKWALQTSVAKLKNPEHNGNDALRYTASAIYTTQFEDEDGWLASTLVFGLNDEENHEALSSVLFETNYNISGSNIYGRYEFVQRLRDDLGIVSDDHDHGVEPVHALTLGYSYPLASFVGLDLSVGAQATYNFLTDGLKEYYGNSPYGAQIYISLHPNLGM